MKWKTVELSTQFARLHPRVGNLVKDLDAFCRKAELPEVVVTHVLRTREEMNAIYVPFFESQGLHLDEAVRRAGEKFSWHLVGCAVDIRNSHYTPAQRKQVMAWLATRCPKPQFELLEHDVGRGDHIHAAIRDFRWRTAWK